MKICTSRALYVVIGISVTQICYAATYDWNGVNSGGGQGVSDVWDTVTENWSGAGTIWPLDGLDNDAVFDTLGDLVTIDEGGVTVNDLRFLVDGYQITGAGLTLVGELDPVTVPQIYVEDASLATIGVVIAGISGWEKSGLGDLSLSGANTYTGETIITQGLVRLQNASGLGSNLQGTIIGAEGSLDINGFNLGTEAFTIAGSGLFGDGALINSGAAQINAIGRLALSANAAVGGSGRWDLRNSSPTLHLNGFTLSKLGSGSFSLVGATVTPGSGQLVVNAGELSIQTSTTMNGGAANKITVNQNATLGMWGLTSAPVWSLELNAGSTIRSQSGNNSWAGPIAVAGSVTLLAEGGLALNSTITGTADLTKMGTGAATLGGNNSWTAANVTVSAGALILNSSSAFSGVTTVTTSGVGNAALVLGNQVTTGAGASITLNGGGYNQFYGALSTAAGNTGTATWQGNAIIGAATNVRVGSLNGVLHISGDISEATAGSALTIRNDENTMSSVQLSGNNSYSGTTTVSAGGLRLGSNQAIGTGPLVFDHAARVASFSSADTTPRTIANATTLNGTAVLTLGDETRHGKLTFSNSLALGTAVRNLQVASETELAGVVSGVAGGINKTGSGRLVLSADNSYSGTTTVAAGTLRLDYSTAGGSKLSNTAALTLGIATLDLAGGAHTEVVSATTLTATSRAQVSRSSGSSILAMNTITRNANAWLNFSESGIASTDNLNQTSGIIGAWATVGGSDWAVNSSNTTDGLITIPTYQRSSVALDVPASYAGSQVSVDSNQTPTGAISPASIRFHEAGSFALNLQGANTIASGGIMVTSQAGQNTSTIAGGTLTGPGSGDLVIHQNNPFGELIISSQIVNNTATNIVKLGQGSATLSGSNTFTGSITASAGTLALTGNKSGNVGTITVANLPGTDATLNITSGTYALGGNSFFVGFAQGTPATGRVNQSGGAVSFTGGNGLLLGNAGSTASTGIYHLSGGSLTTGTPVNRGVIIGANEGSINTFHLSGTGVLNMTSATGGAATSVLQVGRFDAGANNTNNTFQQSGGTANVTIFSVGGNGATGTGIVSQVNWSGGVFMAAEFPRLAAGNGNTARLTISDQGDVTLPAFPTTRGTGATATLIFDGGTLRPAATSTAYLGGLTNAFVRAGGARINVASGRDVTVSQGLIVDPQSTGGGLTKEGVGALILTGASTYTGPTTISAGTLQIGSAGTTGSLAPASEIVNNATLTFQRSNNIVQGTDFGSVISGSGTVTQTGTGITTLNGNNSFTGDITVTAGRLRLAGSSAVGTGTKRIISQGGSRIVELSNSITLGSNVSFVISSNSNDGSGLSSIDGDNVIQGNIEYSFGNPALNISSSAGSKLTIQGNVQLTQTSRTMHLGGASVEDNTIAGAISSNAVANVLSIQKQGLGRWILAGANTYRGNTTVNAGTLRVAAAGQLTFYPTTNGTSNRITGPTDGAAVVELQGRFNFDLSQANDTVGNAWIIVENANVAESYGDTFSVTSTAGAFSETAPGVWERTQGEKKWTFLESTGTLSVAAAPLDDFLVWANSYNPPVGLPTADDDGDGMSNFHEYAFGLDPKSASSVNPISQPLHQATGTFKYTRRATPQTTGVSYSYESSTTLSGTWPSFTPTSEVSNNATPIEEMTVTVPASMLLEPKLFLRVKAQNPQQ